MTGHDCKNGIEERAAGERIVSRFDMRKTPEPAGAYRYAVDALHPHLECYVGEEVALPGRYVEAAAEALKGTGNAFAELANRLRIMRKSRKMPRHS